MPHNLLVEKIMDKLGNKYEALVRMSIIAKKLADGEGQAQTAPSDKVTIAALEQYVKDSSITPAGAPADEPKK